MIVGVLGLGLIGGSLARAYRKAGHQVFAFDQDPIIQEFATISGVVTGLLAGESIRRCDLILLSVYTSGSAAWLKENAPFIKKEALVIDCCGVKDEICKRCFPLARSYGFTFVGGHPMAGSHKSGFKYSKSNLFQGAPMVLVPEKLDNPELLERCKKALDPCHFGSYSITTAEAHDEMIAFTSQMPHILSNAFIKSPTALSHKGFSAGSYKDLTRVAWLNSAMWAELFLSNRENILKELECYIANMGKYKDAIESNDKSTLIALLDEGKKRKEEIDG